MKRLVRLKRALYLISTLSALAIPLLAWLTIGAVWPYAVAAIILFISLSLMDKLHQSYMDKLLLDLSNLVDGIMNMREDSVFSEVEDTLLSKLQNQVIKLSGILKARNHTINKEKNEIQSLISDISHQIKTPVASIRTFGELLQEPGLSEEQHKEYLQMLEQSLDKLLFLTDGMIKMSRLESGIISLKPNMENVTDVILPAIKQVYHKARKKDVEILFDSDHGIMLKMDRGWTTEAIFNILDNAVKYNKEGGKIEITVLRYESFIRIDIADDGMGIPEGEQAKIWGRFYRGLGSKEEEGVGIGLYLSRKIIVSQGGYIKVESDGRGSVFSVFLPISY